MFWLLTVLLTGAFFQALYATMKPTSFKPACTKSAPLKHIPRKIQAKLRTASWKNGLRFVPPSVQKATQKKRLLKKMRTDFPLPAELVAEILIMVSINDTKSMRSVCCDLRDKITFVAYRVLLSRVGNKKHTAGDRGRNIERHADHNTKQDCDHKDKGMSDHKDGQMTDLKIEQNTEETVRQEDGQEESHTDRLMIDDKAEHSNVKQEEDHETVGKRETMRFRFKFTVRSGEPLFETITADDQKKQVRSSKT